jgi:hypothetical protein
MQRSAHTRRPVSGEAIEVSYRHSEFGGTKEIRLLGKRTDSLPAEVFVLEFLPVGCRFSSQGDVFFSRLPFHSSC